MRLVSYSVGPGPSAARPTPGLVVGEEIVDLSNPGVGLPTDMKDLLALGPAALEGAAHAVSGGAARHHRDAVRLHAPVPDPPAILAIGMNYRAHVAEMGRDAPEYQYWFNKQRTAIAGLGDPIVLPAVSTMVDYEGELAMVIGRRCQYVPAAHAMEVVAGFTVITSRRPEHSRWWRASPSSTT